MLIPLNLISDQALRQNGVNFYDHVPAYAEIGAIGSIVEGLPIDKGCIIAGELQAALAEFPMCSIGAFRCVIEDFEYTNSTFSGGTYLKWLEATLEILLAEYLPSLGWQNQRTSLSIWLPQRSARGEVAEAQRLDFSQHDGRITTLGGRSVAYSLVARALEDRACAEEIFNSISSLKIRKIPYYKDVRKRKYKDGYDSATDWYCVHCKEVSNFSRASEERIGQDGTQLPLTDHHRFCQNHKYLGEFMAADFSVAAHLADAAISMVSLPGIQLGQGNIRTELSFDIQAGERVADFLQVGRLFDRGFPDDAFRLAFRNEFFVAGLNRSDSNSAGAKVESRLVTKIARHVGRIDAAMVVELAGLPRTRFR